MRRRAKNIFKTPKGLLTIILALFFVFAAPAQGKGAVKGLLCATLAAALLDALVLRVMKKTWEFPSGAVINDMIVAMVLRAQEPWYVVVITSVAAILGKYMFRSRSANVFNPAALAIVISFYVFHTGQSWWGALTEIGPIGTIILVSAGILITYRVNKTPLVLAFLGTYFLLFTITAFVADARWVAEIFRTPDFQAVLYFAFIILTDPPVDRRRNIPIRSHSASSWPPLASRVLNGAAWFTICWRECWRETCGRHGVGRTGEQGTLFQEALARFCGRSVRGERRAYRRA